MPVSEAEPPVVDEGLKGEAEPVHLWDALSKITSTITDQSKKALHTYAKELSEFVSAVKEEATEAIHVQEEAIKEAWTASQQQPSSAEQSGGFLDTIKSSFGLVEDDEEEESYPSSALDVDFLTSDHAINPRWAEFKASKQVPLLDAHKQAILQNDVKARVLYNELVPGIISEAAFWNGWLFHAFLQKSRPQVKVRRAQTPTAEWESWDNEVLATPVKDKDAPKDDGWDDWE